MRLTLGLLALLLFAFVQPMPAQSFITRDSAGIRIIENSALGDAPVRFRLAPQSVLDVGGLEANPELEFAATRGELRAFPLSDGGLAVFDISRLQLFSKAGERQRVIGRAGSGPQEFRVLHTGCALRGDTLLVIDGQLSRVVMLSAGGSFLQSAQFDDARAMQLHPCFGDGTLLVQRIVGRRPGRVDVDLVRLRRDGMVLNAAARMMDVPARDVVTQGTLSVVAAGAVAYFGDGETAEVRVFRRGGGLVRVIRMADRPVAIRSSELDVELAAVFPPAVVAGHDRETVMARARSQIGRTTWPVFGQLMPGDDGRLWVRQHRRLSQLSDSPFMSESWIAFDSLGRMEGRLVLPAFALRDRAPPRVVAFMRGGVLLLRRDDDGAPHFTLYPLERVGAASAR